MQRLPGLFAAALIACVGAVPASASERATQTVGASAQFDSRTSLRVSTDLLQFDVTTVGLPATIAVEFVAAARTRTDGEVVLTVEPLRAIEGPGGAADVEASVAFAGEGAGTLAGRIAPSSAAAAGRWTGSGRHTGRLRFSLRAGAAGAYTLPVRFVLSAP